MKKLIIAATAALATLVATAATAVTIEVDGIAAYFQNTTGAPVVGEGTNSIRWGSNGQSGYDFVATPTPFIPAGTPFDLGVFTHINNPISPPSITGTELVVGVTGTADGVAFALGGVYQISHFETPNSANPCAAGGVAPCPDEVSVTGALSFFGDDVFNAQGDQIFLDIAGFAGGLPYFLTAENASTSAILQAGFSVDPALAPVPLPAGMVLMLTGMGVVGGASFVQRRRKRA